MKNKKLKYQEMLDQFSDCPPDDFTEVQMKAYRWVHKDEHDNDFKPINLIKPLRTLDEDDIKCIGYGLSMFNSLVNAQTRYKNIFARTKNHLKKSFIDEKGECIALLQIDLFDGIANSPSNNNFGHFTFHEYENSNLRSKINSIFNIFDINGEFIN